MEGMRELVGKTSSLFATGRTAAYSENLYLNMQKERFKLCWESEC